MKVPEELLQERLELLEAGAPLEQCLNDLPEAEAELLKLAVTLREVSYPARNQAIAAAQRAHLLKVANQESRMNNNTQENFIGSFISLLQGWLRPAMTFSGAMVALVFLAVMLGVWGIIASWSAGEEATTEITAEGGVPTELVQSNSTEATANETEQIVSPASPEATESINPTYTALLPMLPVPLVQNPQSATFKEVQGVVEVQQSDGSWTAVSKGDTLAAGQRIRTGKLSSTSIAFYDGSEASLRAESELSIDALDAQMGGSRTIVMTQWLGESEHEVAKVEGESGRYEVLTPSGSGKAKGTSFQVIVTPDLLTYFNVNEGVVDVTNINITVVVVAGQGTIILPGQPPTEPYFRITGEGEVTQTGEVWIIGGQSFQTHENTIFVGMPEVGDWVFVEGHLLEDGTKIADQIILLNQPPDPSFTLVGAVESISDVLWTVAGQELVVNAATVIDEGIVVGDIVHVAGNIIPGGTLVATQIELSLSAEGLPFEFTGIVQEIVTDTWAISGITIHVDEGTEIEAGIVLGDLVQVEGRILEDGRWLADEIKLAEENETRFEFSGMVESIDPWQVAGIGFETRDWTQIEPGIEVGDLVRVEGQIRVDGTWVAEEIKKLDDDEGVIVTFVGIVNSIDPWIVSEIDLVVNENTQIAEGIEVGTLVRVHAQILPDGTWLALDIQPVIPIIGSCFDISAVVIGINGNVIQVSNWTPITLSDDMAVTGELQPDSIIIIQVCYQNGNVIIIQIIVIYIPIIIILPPGTPVPQPTPGSDGWVVICHKPGRNQQTMTVNQSSLSAHLGHGDTLGPCAEHGGPGGSDNGNGNGNGNKKDD